MTKEDFLKYELTQNKQHFNRYFIDTEFMETVGKIELISIAVVNSGTGINSREYYAISKDFDFEAVWNDDWLRENVLKVIFYEVSNMYKKSGALKEILEFNKKNMQDVIQIEGKTNKQIASEILDFVTTEGVNPVFYGWYCDYDWVVFCWLFGRMIDLPKGFPMYCIDLKQHFDLFGISKKEVEENLPKQENVHSALSDALRERQLYSYLVRKTYHSNEVDLGQIIQKHFCGLPIIK